MRRVFQYEYNRDVVSLLIKYRLVLLVMLIFCAHLTSLSSGFSWLDHGDIEQKRAILPLSQLSMSIRLPYAQTGFYRPLVTAIHSIDYALYHDWAPGYHLTNLLLHIGASVSAYVFLQTLLGSSRLEAWFGALLFGVHPLSILPVGAISYRQEPLLAMGVFLTLFFHARYREKGSRGSLIAALICFSAALLTKESALVLLPALLLVWEWRRSGDMSKVEGVRCKGYLFTFYSLLSTFYLLLRFRAVSDLWHTSPISLAFFDAIGTRVAVIEKLLWYLFALVRLPLSDATPVVHLLDTQLVLITLSLVVGLVLWWQKDRRSRILMVVLGIFLSPALNIIPLPRFFSPHYGYLASVMVGPILIALWSRSTYLPAWFRGLSPYASTGWIAATILIIWCTGVSLLAGPSFADDRALFGPEVARDQAFREGHFYLGTYAWKKGDLATASRELAAAATVYPRTISYVDETALVINQAGVLLAMGEKEKAKKLLLKARPSPLVSYNLAVIANGEKHYDRVVSLLHDDAYLLDRPEPLLLLARGYLRTGQQDKAMRVWSFMKAKGYVK